MTEALLLLHDIYLFKILTMTVFKCPQRRCQLAIILCRVEKYWKSCSDKWRKERNLEGARAK